MARVNYDFERRKRDMIKKQKQEAKRLCKEERKKQKDAEAFSTPTDAPASPTVEG